MTDAPALFDHVLEGCRPVPLAGYLKALGVLRLVSEQADATARGWWRDDRFVLRTTLDREALTRFFLEAYAPTPIIAPWNGGSGFYPKDNKDGFAPLSATDASRFQPMREAIALGSSLIAERSFSERPSDVAKAELIGALRTQGDGTLVGWIDAAVALTLDKAAFPPLLGTGGNDGRLDFTNNFMQRLTELFSAETGQAWPRTGAALASSLFGEAVAGLTGAAIGQFSPGAAGGPNAGNGAEGGGRINRWDFVLMIEGSLVFAGGVSRRLESTDASYLSYPFTVRAAAAGFGTASLEEQGDARGELWVPLWERAASLSEVRALFREGRLSVGARPARDGLDAARAIGGLGATRGVAAFERYGFVKRQGLAFLATPLGRRVVQANPRGELLSELDGRGWFERVRRTAAGDQGSADYRSAVRGLEEGVFTLLDRPQDAGAVQQVLVSVGAVARATALRPKLREEPLVASPPPPRLSKEWLEAADDRSPEWRVAVALAGLKGFAAHLGPMKPDGRTWAGKAEFGQADVIAVWGEGSLADNLGAVARRRLLGEEPFEGGRFRASSADVAAFLDARGFDDRRAAELLLGLAWVVPGSLTALDKARPPALPFAYAAIKPLFAPAQALGEALTWARRAMPAKQPRDAEDERLASEAEHSDETHLPDEAAASPERARPVAPRSDAAPALRLPMPPSLPGLLAAERVGEAVRLAQRRARASGLATTFLDDRVDPDAFRYAAGFGPRLLAALTIPVHVGVLAACLRQAYPEAVTEPADAA